ncbi:ScyD/ScyE family protein [Nocardioides anomalus]|uniref:ScyD/ScyE family protein n=1 Tax=Nocardioides anomalus TaxID=2712223 RepID=A0A6G6WG43_9ACTN|nr:ScyD/ScyE family protein [Nocardioides anomalus]QIG44127.1 ScyD/ScyE family protein [Nocardioides anomalus]
MNKRHLVAASAAAALVGSLGAVGGFSSAARAETAEKPTVTPVASKLVSPLSLAVAPDGTRYFSDNFAGLLYKQVPGAAPTVIFQGPKKAEVGAVSYAGGQLRFAVSQGDNEKGQVWTLDSAGTPVLVGDTGKAEKKQNPDGRYHYGFRNLPDSCLLDPEMPIQSWGLKETHPYASTVLNGTTYVADAGANAVFAFGADGSVRSFMVPAAVATITPAAAKGMELPKCAIGKKFAVEAVPTDIEVGPDGKLYVTSLPGGPEDGSLGALGRVVRMDPTTGKAKTVVDGLVSPTGLAVDASGDLYVAQLFPGLISKVAAGSKKAKPFAQVPFPGDVEIAPGGGLVATAYALPGKKPKGQVVTVTP